MGMEVHGHSTAGIDSAGAYENDYGGAGAPASVIEALGDQIDGDGNLVDLSEHDKGNASHAMGAPLNVNAVFDTAEALGIDAERFVDDFVNDRNGGDVTNFSRDDLSTEEKHTAAVAALNAYTLGEMVGGDFGDNVEEARAFTGEAANLADAGDVAGLRAHLESSPGGDASRDVPDEALLNAWSAEMHPVQHLYMNPDSDFYELTHATNVDVEATGEKGFSNGNQDAYQGSNAFEQSEAVFERLGDLYQLHKPLFDSA